MGESKNTDHEISMAKSQVKNSIRNLQKVARILSKKTDADNLPAWMQAKLTDTEHNTDAAASYVDEAKKCWKGYKKTGTQTLFGKTYNRCVKASYEMNGQHLQEKPGDGWIGPTIKTKGGPIGIPNPIRIAQDTHDVSNRVNRQQVNRVNQTLGRDSASLPGERYYNKRTSAAYNRLFNPPKEFRGEETEFVTEQVDASKYGGPEKLLQKLVNDKKKRGESDGGGEVIRTGLQKAHFEPQGELVSEEKPYKVGDVIPSSATKPKPKPTGAGKFKFGIDKTGLKGPENPLKTEEKDACYHKVKSRYKIWPSAYASGALVKCRKVGAKNWGNKSEGYDVPDTQAKFDRLVNAAMSARNPKTKINILKYASMNHPSKLVKTAEEVSNFIEDWQKVNRRDNTDGLSQKAVNAYRRENPGSKLQTAVTEKKPTGKRAKRRASFCRRMKGMKSKLTSVKTARDPDSRINKALRRWNCN